MFSSFLKILLALLLVQGAVFAGTPRSRSGARSKPRPAKVRVKAKPKPKVRAKAKVRNGRSVRKVEAPGVLRLQSSAALVMDQATGEVLVAKQAEAPVPIASLTKLMTAMVVLDAGLNLDEEIRIESEDKDTLRNSRSRLPVGTLLTRGEALLLALAASENRAAHALGRTYPGGTEACVVAMNAKAKALGLSTARFRDTSGLDGGNQAAPRDLAAMVDAAHGYPVIRDYSTRPETEIEAGRRRIAFNNTNGLVRNAQWAIGLSKTGYIREAGKCLVMQAHLSGRPLVIVLMDSWGRYTRQGDAIRIKQWLEHAVKTGKLRK